MAYEDIITLGNEEFTTGANGELINLDDLSDEELAELMGEDDIFDDEAKGQSASGGSQSSFKMDNEYISYMAFMETEKERLENYS